LRVWRQVIDGERFFGHMRFPEFKSGNGQLFLLALLIFVVRVLFLRRDQRFGEIFARDLAAGNNERRDYCIIGTKAGSVSP
jgi:hypothetical protein